MEGTEYPPTERRDFRLNPSLITPLIIPLAFLLLITLLPIPAIPNVLPYGVSTLILAFLYVRFWYVIRVDESGVSRRSLIGWQAWPWEDFENGHVEWRHAKLLLRNQCKPLLSRFMTLAFVRPRDRAILIGIINNALVSAPEPDVPDTVKAGLVNFMLKKYYVEMSTNGIHVKDKKGESEYAWDDVLSVRLEKLTRGHLGFNRLKLVLPDRDLDLRVTEGDGNRSRNWNDAEAKNIAGIVLKHTRPDIVRTFTKLGTPVDLIDAHYELGRRLEMSVKSGLVLFLVFFLPFLAHLLAEIPPLALSKGSFFHLYQEQLIGAGVFAFLILTYVPVLINAYGHRTQQLAILRQFIEGQRDNDEESAANDSTTEHIIDEQLANLPESQATVSRKRRLQVSSVALIATTVTFAAYLWIPEFGSILFIFTYWLLLACLFILRCDVRWNRDGVDSRGLFGWTHVDWGSFRTGDIHLRVFADGPPYFVAPAEGIRLGSIIPPRIADMDTLRDLCLAVWRPAPGHASPYAQAAMERLGWVTAEELEEPRTHDDVKD